MPNRYHCQPSLQLTSKTHYQSLIPSNRVRSWSFRGQIRRIFQVLLISPQWSSPSTLLPLLCLLPLPRPTPQVSILSSMFPFSFKLKVKMMIWIIEMLPSALFLIFSSFSFSNFFFALSCFFLSKRLRLILACLDAYKNNIKSLMGIPLWTMI